MPPRALITGITGQDGSYLAESLLADGVEVWGALRPPVDRSLGVLEPARPQLSLIALDLEDPASVRAAVADVRPDLVFHLGAPTFVPDSWDDPTGTVASIAGGTAALLAAVKRSVPDARVVVASSSEVFGDAGTSPQDERTPMRPRSPYGVAKLAAFGLVRTMRDRHGLHLSSAITFNHESPRRPEHFLPRKVTRAAVAIAEGRQDVVELGDLDAVRDWSDARDVVRGFRLMADAPTPGDYVLASGRGRTVRELVEAAFAAAGVDGSLEERVRVNPEFVRPAEPWPSIGDPSRATTELGWRPEIPFEQTIADMVEADRRG